jgi:hypothetical protein
VDLVRSSVCRPHRLRPGPDHWSRAWSHDRRSTLRWRKAVSGLATVATAEPGDKVRTGIAIVAAKAVRAVRRRIRHGWTARLLELPAPSAKCRVRDIAGTGNFVTADTLRKLAYPA